MSNIKTIVECRWLKEGTEADENPTYEKDRFILLHWGLDCQTYESDSGQTVGINWTVAICQNCKTGDIRTFLPEQLRILGKEVKE